MIVREVRRLGVAAGFLLALVLGYGGVAASWAQPSPSSGTFRPGAGRVIPVGPQRELKLPSQAARVARDGDTIAIDAGDYIGDVAVWRQNALTLRGAGGRARLHAAGNAAEGKGIWVLKGRNTTVENIEFVGARVSDRNGAGIRQEGAGLTVVDSVFRGCENGILSGAVPDSVVVIRDSEFTGSGNDAGSAHGIYIGGGASLTVTGSYFYGNRVGHHLKTRAHVNRIFYNRLMDLEDGNSSRAIDISNGGTTFIVGNLIQQGPRTENSNIIGYALEGPTNPSNDLHVVHNTIVNDHRTGVFIQTRSARSAQPARVLNNVFAGPGAVLRFGTGTIANNVLVAINGHKPRLRENTLGSERIADNREASRSLFVDAARRDYRLRPGAEAIDAGAALIAADGVPAITVDAEPQAPTGTRPRPRVGPPDAGAYEFVAAR